MTDKNENSLTNPDYLFRLRRGLSRFSNNRKRKSSRGFTRKKGLFGTLADS